MSRTRTVRVTLSEGEWEALRRLAGPERAMAETVRGLILAAAPNPDAAGPKDYRYICSSSSVFTVDTSSASWPLVNAMVSLRKKQEDKSQ